MDGTSNLAIQYDTPAYAGSYIAAPEREHLPAPAPLSMPRQPLLEGGVMADRAPLTSPADIVRRRTILFTATLLLTGLTRDGVYLIEDGEITAAVNNFRFNESPLDLLRRATEAGVPETTLPREWSDWATRAVMPTLRIPDFHMSSVSQAQ